ncbi:MAG: hypothetical protein DI531_15410 [Brevundimonas sp.]|uniref:hypothetical protein n=1 Tax=Brevundimonas sp. TaxID=1871086 RepID=UPI000DB5DFEC|nr:hypothetical protein [Brevundimonas sp.]PZU71650.1 MAG: hypothetical protein DI531_15410 [Brevundimonas sp.]
MANGLWNAGFLQGGAHWLSTGTLSVDEQNRGAPGRAVLRASKVVPTSGASVQIEPAVADRVAVAAGQVVELSGAALGLLSASETPAAPRAFVIFYDAGGWVVESRPLAVRPPEIAGHSPGRAGVRGSFYSILQREVAPAATAKASLWIEAQSTAANQTVTVLSLKPMLALVENVRSVPMLWTPGQHDDPDLGFQAWPDILKPFRSGAGGEPQPGRVEYQAGAGRPKSRRVALDPVRKFVGQVRCDGVERAALEQFWREGPGDFWMVEPDTDRLCVASWAADGAPTMVEQRGPTCLMQVGLWMETA